MPKQIRQVIFWAHLAVALSVGIVVLIMSVTGVLLTYQRQLTWWADTRSLNAGPPHAGAQPLDSETLLAGVRASVDTEPTGFTWRSDPEAPASVALGRGRVGYVNRYTGEMLGEGSTGIRSFFRVATDWHRYLARPEEDRPFARSITGWSNIGFLFIVVSGFFLWWPRNWSPQALRNVILFRGGLRGKPRDFNWHNVIGFWSAIPLAVVVASATVISFPWATGLAYRVAGDTPPPPANLPGGAARPDGAAGAGAGSAGAVAATATGGGGARGESALDATSDEPETGPIQLADLAALDARAEAQVPGWTIITRTLSENRAAPVSFMLDTGDGGQPQKRATLVLDAATADIVRWEPFSSGSPGRKFRSILRFAHTGEVGGLIGQTVAGLVSLGAVFLVYTGFALTLRRFIAWRGRDRRVSAAPTRTRKGRERVGAA